MVNNGFGYGTLIPNPQILMRDPKLPRVPTMPKFHQISIPPIPDHGRAVVGGIV